MKKIKLSQNKYSLVDDEDYIELSKYKWSYMPIGYAIRQDKITKKFIYLHRQIMKVTDKKILCDHINFDKLDNQKSNLRLCTKQQNEANKKKPINNTSGYKGVTWRKDIRKWQSQIMINAKHISLGVFKNKEAAAQAYNNAAYKYFSQFACINIIN